jgi:hypothetical protein
MPRLHRENQTRRSPLPLPWRHPRQSQNRAIRPRSPSSRIAKPQRKTREGNSAVIRLESADHLGRRRRGEVNAGARQTLAQGRRFLLPIWPPPTFRAASRPIARMSYSALAESPRAPGYSNFSPRSPAVPLSAISTRKHARDSEHRRQRPYRCFAYNSGFMPQPPTSSLAVRPQRVEQQHTPPARHTYSQLSPAVCIFRLTWCPISYIMLTTKSVQFAPLWISRGKRATPESGYLFPPSAYCPADCDDCNLPCKLSRYHVGPPWRFIRISLGFRLSRPSFLSIVFLVAGQSSAL